MRTEELRIGNYLLGYDNSYFTWDYKHFDLCSKGIDTDELGIPIPLTEEILLECEGIIKHPTIKNRYELEDYGIYFNIEDGNWDEPSLDVLINGMYIICVEFLHEFQNLMFAITGQELKIEL